MAPLASPMGLGSLNYIKCSTNPQLDFLLSIKCDVASHPAPPKKKNEHYSQLRGASRPAEPAWPVTSKQKLCSSHEHDDPIVCIKHSRLIIETFLPPLTQALK